MIIFLFLFVFVCFVWFRGNVTSHLKDSVLEFAFCFNLECICCLLSNFCFFFFFCLIFTFWYFGNLCFFLFLFFCLNFDYMMNMNLLSMCHGSQIKNKEKWLPFEKGLNLFFTWLFIALMTYHYKFSNCDVFCFFIDIIICCETFFLY